MLFFTDLLNPTLPHMYTQFLQWRIGWLALVMWVHRRWISPIDFALDQTEHAI